LDERRGELSRGAAAISADRAVTEVVDALVSLESLETE
jgi:hypothetical protein